MLYRILMGNISFVTSCDQLWPAHLLLLLLLTALGVLPAPVAADGAVLVRSEWAREKNWRKESTLLNFLLLLLLLLLLLDSSTLHFLAGEAAARNLNGFVTSL